MRSLLLMLTLVLGCAIGGTAQASASLVVLFDAAPEPPADAATAAGWVRDGQVVALEVTALEAQLKSARAAVASAADGAVKTNLAASSSAPVLAAVNGYKAYVAANSGAKAPAAVLGARAKWLAGRFSGLRKRISDPAGLAEVREQELAAYRALFKDWESSRRGLVVRAETDLSAAGDLAAIASAEHRSALVQYRVAALGEVDVLLGLTRLAVEHAAGLKAADPSTVPPGANTLWDLMSDPRKRPAS